MGMTADKQAELIHNACRECGLDGHVKWIEGKQDVQSWAEKIAGRFRNKRNMPIKNSYMYCDQLDMCFSIRSGICQWLHTQDTQE